MSDAPPILPIELCELILRLVHELDEHERNKDSKPRRLRATLACALVCRSWLSLTRPYTFKALDCTFAESEPDTLVALGNLVAAPVCTFFSYVQALQLVLPGWTTDSSLNKALEQLALLPNVKALTMHRARQMFGMSSYRHNCTPTVALPLFTPCVERLEVDSTVFSRPGGPQVVEAVSRCTGLRSLTLRGLQLDELLRPFPTLVHMPPVSPFLESITLNHHLALSQPVLNWLCSDSIMTGPRPRISLALANISSSTGADVARFLYTIGLYVRSLDLSFQASSLLSQEEDRFCEAADLTTLVNIERLRFSHLIATEWMSTREWQLHHIPFILEQISAASNASSLERIELSFQSMTSTTLGMVNWRRILRALNAKAKFPKLKKVVFNVRKLDMLVQLRPLLHDCVANVLRDDVEVEYHAMQG